MTRLVLLAPAFLAVYGGIRFLDGRDGRYGPGPAWTIGHLFFLGALLLFAGVIVGVRRRILAAEGGGRARRVTAGVLTTVTYAGLATFVRVAVLDIVVGLKAADAAEKSALSDRYAADPAILPQTLYEIGPVFFMLGLVALFLQYAVVGPRRGLAAALGPVLILAGFLVITADLGLLPVGALLIGFALAPLTREIPAPPVRTTAPAPAPAPA